MSTSRLTCRLHGIFTWACTLSSMLCFLVLAPSLELSSACRHSRVREPLIDPSHPPLVYTESDVIVPEENRLGGRFIGEWRQATAPKGGVSPTGGPSYIEFFALSSRKRQLVLETTSPGGDPSSLVSVTIGRRRLGTYVVSPEINVPLPADLPLGRNLIRLDFPSSTRLVIRRARLEPAVVQGHCSVRNSSIFQSGWSVLDIIRPVGPAARLVGEFRPPLTRTDERFLLIADHGEGSTDVLFRWPASGQRQGKDRSAVRLDIPLPGHPGLIRVRLVALGAGNPGTWANLAVDQALRPLRHAPESRLPKPPRIVILYVMDALRADVFGAVNHEGSISPHDGLTEQSTCFLSHYSVAPNTPPSTEALFTGHYVLSGGRLAPDGGKTLAEIYGKAGYKTVLISSNPYFSNELGLTRGFQDVQLLPLDEDFNTGAKPTVNRSAEMVDEEALQWLEHLGDNDRVFMYLHTLNPHNPYTPPPEVRAAYVDDRLSNIEATTATLVGIRNGKIQVTPSDETKISQLYTACAAYNVAHVQNFLRRLRRMFEERELLFVLTSDHGEELFEHCGVLHGYTLYNEALHIPLVVFWPGVVRRSSILKPTDTIDLHETLRDLVTHQDHPHFRGHSLWPLLLPGLSSHRDANASAVLFAAAPARGALMARSGDWKLILAGIRGPWGMGRGRGQTRQSEYLFNLRSDPGEQVNLSGNDPLEVQWLRSALLGWASAAGRARTPGADPRVDELTRRRLKALGYGQ